MASGTLFIPNKALWMPNGNVTQPQYGTDMRAIETFVNSLVFPASFVEKIIAGTNITITPATGTGDVTISASGGGGGTGLSVRGGLKATGTFLGTGAWTTLTHVDVGTTPPIIAVTSPTTTTLVVRTYGALAIVTCSFLVRANITHVTNPTVGLVNQACFSNLATTQTTGMSLTWPGGHSLTHFTFTLSNTVMGSSGHIFIRKPTITGASPIPNLTTVLGTTHISVVALGT